MAEAGFAVPGAIGAEYKRLGGAPGAVGPATAGQECGLTGGGCLQTFANGTIVWSAGTGAHLLAGAIETGWLKYGGSKSYLGYPLAAAGCVGTAAGSVCHQKFQRGSLYNVPGTGTYPVWGGMNATYESLGGIKGYLGYPKEAEKCGEPAAGHCIQHFQRGLIYYGPGGTWQIWGAVGAAYDNLGGPGSYLGYPTAAEQCGLPGGACRQTFQRGAVYFAPGAGTFPVWGAINAKYEAHGGSRGYLGYPTGAEKCGLRGGGCSQSFQRGNVYYAAGAGTQAVWGGVGQFYSARKAQNGALGYPTTAEACNGSGYCSQSFQYGVLQWIPGTGVRYRINTAAYCPAISTGAVKYRTADASRVTFAIADEYGSTRINFITCVRQADGSYAKEWGALGHAGESGFAGPGAATGPTWQKYSPTGSFTVTEAFGLGNPGTKLAYRQLNAYSRWGGRLNGNYNKYFESSADVFPDENMWYFATRPSHDYRQGVVINYNRPPDAPITMNAGFAIFLHGNNLPTWGCISLNDGDLLQYLRTANPGDRFVMGVAYDIFN
ncbi:L,D-transpeptidase family protein [Pseudarthrobacter sp. MM222]|uniref:L,D-transpeptidase family protein n=1 Tax=Pseudarthrobacter sp. MM222 TaxID=3018929 RepID=UPI00221F9938|nr:L,D-transpeptidase family protein [Pseudarthrobacter sp. MM222]